MTFTTHSVLGLGVALAGVDGVAATTADSIRAEAMASATLFLTFLSVKFTKNLPFIRGWASTGVDASGITDLGWCVVSQ